MLILAGVSINAIVGDNGILTKAQSASIKSGMAALEEFLQQKYVENIDEIAEESNKIAFLSNLESCKKYFYKPNTDDGIGGANYIVDSNGHALYLINKSGLPIEMQKSLIGGNCGIGKTGSERYRDYANLLDVYGVTSELKVYYSTGDGNFIGLDSADELDKEDLSRPVIKSSTSLGKVLSKLLYPDSDTKDITVADAQLISILNIDDSSVTSLNDLYALSSLTQLTLTGLNLENLDGIQNAMSLNYVYLKDCTIEDYSALSELGDRIKYLYLYDIDDSELSKLCLGIKDANFPNLEYFGVFGVEDCISSTENLVSGSRTATKYITNIEPLRNLKDSVVGNIKFLNLQGNGITNVVNNGITKYALENLENFTNIEMLRLERNQLTTLKGIGKLTKLKYLYVYGNQLGVNEIYDIDGGELDERKGKNPNYDALSELASLNNLYILRADANINLKWVSYLKSNTALRYLYFGTDDNSKIIGSEISQLATIFKNCELNKSYPGKYGLVMLDRDALELEVNLIGQTITKDQFIALGTYQNIKWLDLYNVTIVNSDADSSKVTAKDDINTLATSVLKKLKNLKYLRIRSSAGKSFYNFNDLTFLKGENLTDSNDDINLIELDCLNTMVSTKEKNESGIWVDYDNGLKLLNTQRVGLKTFYCSNMTNLNCNESHINFASISDFTCRIVQTLPQSYFNGTYARGLYCINPTAMATVSGCVNMTVFRCSVGGSDYVYDLKNCNKLTSVTINWIGNEAYWILPSSCTYANLDNSYGNVRFDFSRVKRIDLNMNGCTEEGAIACLKGIGPETQVGYIGFKGNFGDNCTDFSMFKAAYESRALSERFRIKINKFIIYSNNNTKVTSLNGLEYIDGLQELEIRKDGLNNLQNINALESQKDTIKKISIIDCPVADCQVISKLTKLEYLDLTSNNLQPSRPIQLIDDEGNLYTDTWYTLREICNRMRANSTILNKKVTLKLKGNSKLVDWSEYTKDTTKWTSDSTYGSE